MRVTRGALLLMAALSWGSAAGAQELWPGATYDPGIPTVKSVLGHDVGEEISTPEEIAIYLRALAGAAPDRTRLVEYARTWEGRPLHVLIVGSPARIAALDAIKADLKRLADPRAIDSSEADRLVASLPVVVWLMHAVHGNEISSSDAALAEAYHLLAAHQRSRGRRDRAQRTGDHRPAARTPTGARASSSRTRRGAPPSPTATVLPPSTTSRGPAAAPTTICST